MIGRTRWLAPATVTLLVALATSAVAGVPALLLPSGLPEPADLRVRRVAERASVAGRVTGDAFQVRPAVFEYLLDHPEFATHVTRALDIGPYRVWRQADGLWLDDGRGAVGRFEIVYAAHGTRVVHLRGAYKPALLPSIQGQAVAILEYAALPAAGARVVVTPTLTGFLKIENALVELASRVLSDVAAAKAERLARRVVRDAAKTARAIEEDPARVRAELARRPDVPAAELAAFTRLLEGS